jgi:radical SAM superfamily enzyme YgiQ (UPF0313 family)
MKIVLVNPPFEEAVSVGASKSIKAVLNIIPPLGIAYLAGVLEKHNYPVKIFDCTVGIPQSVLIDSLSQEEPDIVGITSTTPSLESAKRVAQNIKEVFPRVTIVIGGCHVTAMPQETLQYDCFDIGVVGEGEDTFLELVREIDKGRLSKLGKIKGIVYKKDGQVTFTGRREFVRNLDTIPFPARHLLPPLGTYSPTPASYRKLPLAVVMTSRGCPNRCTFCDRAIFGSSYRARSADNVLDEVEELIDRYGAKEIRFFDDTFTLDKSRVFEICDKLKERGIRIPWTCLTTVNSVSKELLAKMKEAGCWQVLYGLESGDDRMLKLLKKGNTVARNAFAVKLAKETGLEVRGDFIVGTPGETKESLERTLDFTLHNPLDYAHFNKFIPFPGTELYNMLLEQGYKFDFSKGCSILDHSAIMYTPEGFSNEEFKAWLDRANKAFYLRPSHILRRLLALRTLTQLEGQIKGFFAIRHL